MELSDENERKFNSIIKPKKLENEKFWEVLLNSKNLILGMLDQDSNHELNTFDDFIKIEEEIYTELPNEGKNIEEILETIKLKIVPGFNYENNNFFGYIPRSPTNVSKLGDMLVPIFDQYLGNSIGSPSATAIEGLVVKWIGQMLGYEGGFFGSFTIGGSDANLQAIYSGLVAKLPWDVKKLGMINNRRPIVYCSDQTHLCIKKAMMMLGLGRNSLRIIDTNDNLEIDKEILISTIEDDLKNPKLIPIMIIGNVGTTNSGSIDDIIGLNDISKKYNLWFHIDASYGGFAILSNHSISKNIKKIGLADSIVVDTHKWLFTPMEGGLTLVKNGDLLKNAFSYKAEYLEDTYFNFDTIIMKNFSDYGMALSRKWRGIMIWMNIQFYGLDGISKLITRNIILADILKNMINDNSDLYLHPGSKLGVVCFKHINHEINAKFISNIQQNRTLKIGYTKIKNEKYCRISILGEDLDIEIIKNVYQEIINNFKKI